jgi:hypothetical protein
MLKAMLANQWNQSRLSRNTAALNRSQQGRASRFKRCTVVEPGRHLAAAFSQTTLCEQSCQGRCQAIRADPGETFNNRGQFRQVDITELSNKIGVAFEPLSSH